MCYISVRPERHSYDIIRRNMEFTINLTTEALAEATDWCGVRSGKDYNKFAEMGLTPVKGSMVSAPIVAESPLSIECRVKEIVKLGTHDMFIADVLCTDAEKSLIDPETGAFDLGAAGLIAYSHGTYYKLGEPKLYFDCLTIGKFQRLPDTRLGWNGTKFLICVFFSISQCGSR